MIIAAHRDHMKDIEYQTLIRILDATRERIVNQETDRRKILFFRAVISSIL